MLIPDKVDILGVVYDVILKKEKDDSGPATGTCSPFYQRIWLSEDRPETGRAVDFLHEIIEAINDANDLKLEHQTLSTLATSLYQVMVANRLTFWGTNES